MRKPLVMAVAFGLLFVATSACGRTTEGALDGVVLNGKGAPVAFAQILWQAADGKAPHAVRANGSGHFHIAGVRQGLYDIRAEGLGLVSDWEHNVYVPTGKVANVTLRLTHRIPPPGSSAPSKR